MCPNPQFPLDLLIFTEEILNGKFNFLCSVSSYKEQLLSCSTLSHRCYYKSKNFKRYTVVNTNINDDKSFEVGTVAEFQLLILDSL